MQPRRCHSPRHTQSCTRFLQRWPLQPPPSPSSTGSSALDFICVPTLQPQLTCAPRLCFLQTSRHRHSVIWLCACREAPSPFAHLPTWSTLQRVVPACPTTVALLCPGQPEDVSLIHWVATTPSPMNSQLLTPSFSFVGYSSSALGYPLEFSSHFYSYSIFTAK